jgi:hypothetical protein
LKVRHHMNVFVFIMYKKDVYCVIIVDFSVCMHGRVDVKDA